MHPTSSAPRARTAPVLVTGGFALLAFGALLAVLSLASAELENPSQAAGWSMAAFGLGVVGAASAVVGAFLRARA